MLALMEASSGPSKPLNLYGNRLAKKRVSPGDYSIILL